MATTPASNRYYRITPNDNGNILDFGPAGAATFSGVFDIQFSPSVDFLGGVYLVGKVGGPASTPLTAPFLPMPYMRVVVNNIASDMTIVADPIDKPGMIRTVASRVSFGLMVNCTQGYMDVVSLDTSS